MLTTSPILANSANASPTGCRRGHAPTRSPQESPRPSPSRARRPSSSSPSQLRSRPSGAADDGAAPNEPRAEGQQEAMPPSQSLQTDPPPPPRPQVVPTATASTSSSLQSLGDQVQQALSPHKRRGSPGQRFAQASTSASAPASPNQSTKRPKPDEQPPKILPRLYEHCPVEDMVELIAHMLAELIATNDAIRISSGGLTRFHSRTAPGISVRDYLHRLARHATLIPPLLLAMVYYIDRLCALYPEFTINTLTVHRFLITAATVAAKGLSDSFWNNTTYARVGGVRVAELKLLELEFLYRVDWKIVPNPEVLVAYYQGLVERTPGYALESDGSSDEYLDDDDEQQGGASAA
ncbi:Nuc-1 negative regulatory protein preg [Tolypocladium paradoxum]|uniref:Nuc-1 negative regulatory protein preg n=1 Tax=Tolypocladium paradoxum TaxID=94208 RepID=A0A2S4KNW5_9HYPO|nr:Nuc-1 negative regulatory protein preg [Tolypocladium paradoxum]